MNKMIVGFLAGAALTGSAIAATLPTAAEI